MKKNRHRERLGRQRALRARAAVRGIRQIRYDKPPAIDRIDRNIRFVAGINRGVFAGRSVAVGGFDRGLGFNRGSGFNHGFTSRFARSGHFNHFHHFRNRNRFAFFPGFVGGGWDWGYPYDYAAYGNGCWRWDGWQWINACYDYGGYNYGN